MNWQNTEAGPVKDLPDPGHTSLFDQPGLAHATQFQDSEGISMNSQPRHSVGAMGTEGLRRDCLAVTSNFRHRGLRQVAVGPVRGAVQVITISIRQWSLGPHSSTLFSARTSTVSVMLLEANT